MLLLGKLAAAESRASSSSSASASASASQHAALTQQASQMNTLRDSNDSLTNEVIMLRRQNDDYKRRELHAQNEVCAVMDSIDWFIDSYTTICWWYASVDALRMHGATQYVICIIIVGEATETLLWFDGIASHRTVILTSHRMWLMMYQRWINSAERKRIETTITGIARFHLLVLLHRIYTWYDDNGGIVIDNNPSLAYELQSSQSRQQDLLQSIGNLEAINNTLRSQVVDYQVRMWSCYIVMPCTFYLCCWYWSLTAAMTMMWI